MTKYRIITNGLTYKIQKKCFLFFWLDMKIHIKEYPNPGTYKEFPSYSSARNALLSLPKNWEVCYEKDIIDY